MTAEPNGSITMDQYDRFTMPLGKAHSILELFHQDLTIDQANGVYVVEDLNTEAKQIGEGSKTHRGGSIGSGQEHYRAMASYLDQAW